VIAVHPAGIRVRGPRPAPQALDVVFNGHRVWSFTPVADPAGRDVVYSWPPALKPYLEGRADVAVSLSATGERLDRQRLQFGRGTKDVRIVDAAGRWLSINKWGHLGKAFENRDDGVQQRLLTSVVRVMDDLREIGLEPFLVYGSLLGAVREGRVMPHDDDADISYLSRHEDPADVALEQLALRHHLRARGHSLMVHSLGHVQVQFSRDGAPDHYLDIFTSFVAQEHYHLPFHVRVPRGDVTVLPLTTVVLDGHELPAPADPGALLTATYGPNWATPDPGFSFRTPPTTKAAFSAWLGDFSMRHGYWQNFYSGLECAEVPESGSTFAQWVTGQLPAASHVLEVGTGTGRDALHLARHGHAVHAVDRSAAGIARVSERAAAEDAAVTTEVVNLSDLTDVLDLLAALPTSTPWHLYARFFLHSIDDETRSNFWVVAAAAARTGGQVWLEFRTAADAQQPKVFREHYRNYLHLSTVLAEAAEAGLDVVHVEEGQGLAPYKSEDPVVARLQLAPGAALRGGVPVLAQQRVPVEETTCLTTL
jgi:SAM-dependent methyltransferase